MLNLCFDSNFHGNFSPGSFFLSGAISEWPNTNFLFILNFLVSDFQ